MIRMRKALSISIVLFLLLGAALAAVAGCGGGGDNGSSEAQQSTTSSLSEAELEALVYPGAQEEDLDARGMAPPDGSSAPMSRPESPEGMPEGSAPPLSSAPGGGGPSGGPGMRGNSMNAAYWTVDSVEKVSAWYQQELSNKTGFEEVTMPSRGGSDQSGQSGSMKVYSFELDDTTVMLMLRTDTQERGGTIITIGEAPEGMPSSAPDGQSQ